MIREAPERKADAVLVVAMDRLMGLISLILLAGLVVLCRYHWLAMTPATGWLESVTLLILAGGVGMLVLSGLVARLPWLAMLENHPAVGAKLREIGQAFRAYRRHWPRMIQALANTLAAHLFYFLTFYCAARALGAFGGPGESPWRGLWDVFSIMPIVNTLTGLPISFAGIGIRESLFQVLLKNLCGIAPGVGAAIGSPGVCDAGGVGAAGRGAAAEVSGVGEEGAGVRDVKDRRGQKRTGGDGRDLKIGVPRGYFFMLSSFAMKAEGPPSR